MRRASVNRTRVSVAVVRAWTVPMENSTSIQPRPLPPTASPTPTKTIAGVTTEPGGGRRRRHSRGRPPPATVRSVPVHRPSSPSLPDPGSWPTAARTVEKNRSSPMRPRGRLAPTAPALVLRPGRRRTSSPGDPGHRGRPPAQPHRCCRPTRPSASNTSRCTTVGEPTRASWTRPLHVVGVGEEQAVVEAVHDDPGARRARGAASRRRTGRGGAPSRGRRRGGGRCGEPRARIDRTDRDQDPLEHAEDDDAGHRRDADRRSRPGWPMRTARHSSRDTRPTAA